MSAKLIPILDKRTGVVAMLPEPYLRHPQWAEHFEEVRSSKPRVKLDGEPKPVPDTSESKAFTLKKGNK